MHSHTQLRFSTKATAFTLIEILVVVLILGILAAIVVPKFANATDTANENVTLTELMKIRRAIDIYIVKYGVPPTIIAGTGIVAWGELIPLQYIKSAPSNPWVGGVNRRVVVLGNIPDAAYQSVHGWIYDAATGDIWAGSFDLNDAPIQP